MIEISVDELRVNLRKYLRQVEQGDALVITRDGKAVARILPEHSSLDEKAAGLVGAGLLKWGGKSLSPWRPVAINKGHELISDLINQERKAGH